MNTSKIKRVFLISSCIILLASSTTIAAQLPKWFPFSKKDSLKEWEEKLFKGRVIYSVKVENSNGYLSAYSSQAASGILYKLRFDPKINPMISWQWKVVKFPSDTIFNGTEKKEVKTSWIEKDDYAARVYIIFPKLAFNMTKTLEYVWDPKLPKDTILTSPYFENIKIIVLETGKDNLGKWVFEERNIFEDYKKAFNRSPGEVGAIAIMTDTDNTASTAEALYDEIKVGYKEEVQNADK